MTDPSMFVPLEEVVSTAPLTVRREIRWSDCDPAGIVHTSKFPDYALSATNMLRTLLFGADWYNRLMQEGVVTPAKAISLVFHSSLWPLDRIDIRLFVGDVRERSADFLIDAVRSDNGIAAFSGRVSPVCMGATGPRAAIPWPTPFRTALIDYRDAHAVPDALKKLGI